MGIDSGSVFSEVRIRLDKLSADIQSAGTAFDNLSKEFQEKAENAGTAAWAAYKKSLTQISAEIKNVAEVAKTGALNEAQAIERLIALRKEELKVLQDRAVKEGKASAETVAAIHRTQEALEKLEKQQKELDKTGTETGGSIMSTFRDMQSVMMGPFAALQTGIRIIKQAGQAVAELEGEWANQAESSAKLGAVFKSVGAEAWTTMGHLKALAESLAETTKYADEEIESMEAVLLGFRKIQGVNFDKAVASALDMAQVMGLDLVNAAQSIGKALDDPIKGLDSLQRQGFRWTEQEKEMLAQMVETGNIAEAQKIILDELAKTFGGAAEAVAKTSGAMKEMKDKAIGELKEEVGRAISGSGFMVEWRRSIKDIADGWAEALRKYNEYKDARAKEAAGKTLTTNDELTILEGTLKQLEKKRYQLASEGLSSRSIIALKGMDDEIANIKKQIEATKNLIKIEEEKAKAASEEARKKALLAEEEENRKRKAAEREQDFIKARTKAMETYNDKLEQTKYLEEKGVISAEEAISRRVDAAKSATEEMSKIAVEFDDLWGKQNEKIWLTPILTDLGVFEELKKKIKETTKDTDSLTEAQDKYQKTLDVIRVKEANGLVTQKKSLEMQSAALDTLINSLIEYGDTGSKVLTDAIALHKSINTQLANAETVDKRATAEANYRAALQTTETKVKEGVITYQQAAKENASAAESLITVLISLGDTGSVALQNAIIKQREWTLAVGQTVSQYSELKTAQERYIERRLKATEAQDDADAKAMEAADALREKQEAIDRRQAEFLEKRLDRSEEIHRKEDAAIEAQLPIVDSVEQQKEQIRARADAAELRRREAMDRENQAFAKAASQAEIDAADTAYHEKKRFEEGFINRRLAGAEEVHKAEDAYNDAIIEGASGRAQQQEQLAQRRIDTAKRAEEAEIAIHERAIEAQAKKDAEIAETLANEKKVFEEGFINRRLEGVEKVHKAEDEIDKIIIEGASSQAQAREQLAQRRIETARRAEEAEIAIHERAVAEQARKDAEAAETAAHEKKIFEEGFVNRRLEGAEKIHKAEEEINRQIIQGASSKAQLEEQLAQRRIALTARIGEANANLIDLAARKEAEAEANRISAISQEEYLERWRQSRDADLANAEDYYWNLTGIYKDLFEAINLETNSEKKAFLNALLAKVNAAQAAGASIQEITLTMAREAQKFTLGKEIDAQYKAIALSSEQAFAATLKEWEKAKEVFADDADRLKKINDIIEKIKGNRVQQAIEGTIGVAISSIQSITSALESLFTSSADAAIDAVERRLDDLKKSYGANASELRMMYEALSEMGDKEAAANIKAQMTKQEAIEKYASMSEESLAQMYAAAIENGKTETAAIIAQAQARVAAEKNAEKEIAGIQYEAELAAWQFKKVGAIASTAQAAIDAYASAAKIPAVGWILGPLAAAAAVTAGGIQLAAIDKAKPQKPKLETGGIVLPARSAGTDVTVAERGNGEILFGTGAMGEPLMQAFAELVASKVTAAAFGQPIVVQIPLDGRVVAESTVKRINSGEVRLKR